MRLVSKSFRLEKIAVHFGAELLKSYVTRLENKDSSAKTTREWRIVARVLDRIFFFCYIGTIVVSLFTIFPRDGGDSEHTIKTDAALTTPAPAEPDIDIEAPVTMSDLSFVYDDYGDMEYR